MKHIEGKYIGYLERIADSLERIAEAIEERNEEYATEWKIGKKSDGDKESS